MDLWLVSTKQALTYWTEISGISPTPDFLTSRWTSRTWIDWFAVSKNIYILGVDKYMNVSVISRPRRIMENSFFLNLAGFWRKLVSMSTYLITSTFIYNLLQRENWHFCCCVFQTHNEAKCPDSAPDVICKGQSEIK